MYALNPAGSKVLIVEDNPDDAQITAKALERFGIGSYDWTQTGEEAIAFLGEETCDVVLADYNLPGMNGIRLLERIGEEWPDVRVIIVTGARNEEVAVAAMKAGASDYVAKDELLTSGIVRSLQAALRSQEAAASTDLRAALSSGEGKLETARQEIAWLSDAFPTAVPVAAGTEPEVPNILADDSLIQRPETGEPLQELIDAVGQYLRAAFDSFPQVAAAEEQALLRMIVDRGISPGDVVNLFAASLRSFSVDQEEPPFSPALCLTRIFALLVEQQQESAALGALRNAS